MSAGAFSGPRLFLLAALLAVPLAAGGTDETAPPDVVVNRPRPGSGEPFLITYVFKNPKGSIRPPAALPLKNLTSESSVPGTSNQISMINMDVTKTVTFTWQLRAGNPGQGEIGETTWTVGDKTVKGHPYVVDVGPPRPAGSQPQGGGQEEDPFGMPRPFRPAFPAPGGRDARPRQEPVVLYVVTPDRTTAYVGEEIVLHYELVTQADISGLEYVEAPKFQGVWAEDLEKPEKPEGRRDTYEGKTVTRFTILKKAVAPLAPGNLTIPPATVRLAVRMGGSDPFADPFSFMRPTVVERSTKPLSIKVLPIPGHPDFKGPVGRFDLHASVDRDRIAAGEAVTLKVKMTGNGNLRTSLEAPRLEVPGARVYPPTTKNSTSRSAGHPVAQAEWSYVVVPASPGDFTIPAVRVSVFDPAEKRVVEKTTAPVRLLVDGSAAAAKGAADLKGGAAETVAAAGAATTEAAAPPAALPAAAAAAAVPPPSPRTLSAAEFASRQVTFPLWALIGVPASLLVAGGAALAVRKRIRSRGETVEALKGEPGEPKERAAARIDRALRSHLQRRWGIPETAPGSAILDSLASAGVPAEAREGVRTLLAELDFLRFAPQLGEYGEKIEEARRQAARVFRQLQ